MPVTWIDNFNARWPLLCIGQQSSCGIMFTRAMYRNIPAIKALRNPVSKPPTPIPTVMPMKHRTADSALYIIARFTLKPADKSTAKSPTSCGNSWHKIAIEVDMPPPIPPVANEIPIARPSKKLCRPSPVTIIIITDLVEPCEWWCWWWWWCSVNCTTNPLSGSVLEVWKKRFKNLKQKEVFFFVAQFAYLDVDREWSLYDIVQ